MRVKVPRVKARGELLLVVDNAGTTHFLPCWVFSYVGAKGMYAIDKDGQLVSTSASVYHTFLFC